ncbi:104_t:CDS:2 [Rhizophagus irregularis]|nr:104_t:CDS:2 [Rhizophagus irregularis]
MKSAVISQELQLGILSNRVKTMSKKEEESELVGGRTFSFLTHLESKRPAEEYSPVTILPPNLWIALLFNEEVNENEESLTKVQLFISKMENVNCKYHIINLFEKNLVKKILGGNETICQRKTEYVKVESVFDDNVQTSSIKVIFKDEFDFKKHYENLWCKISIGNLYACSTFLLTFFIMRIHWRLLIGNIC